MKYGLGIDTGGTYTDAVVYDYISKEIIYTHKTLTTKNNLIECISNVIDSIPKDFLDDSRIISLSTTLATNACVENKGGRVKLILIGADKRIVLSEGPKYGLPSIDEIMFVDCVCDLDGTISIEPDWIEFKNSIKDQIDNVDSIAIVSLHAMRNEAILERKAVDHITQICDLPIICGHELFSDLNILQRASGVILNAKLLPIINDFLRSINITLKERSIDLPVVVVRSDGSIMSKNFTSSRPVETLLSGPAASVMGGIDLSMAKDALIIDMGGTTTDISIVEDSIPKKATEGINIGKWRTFVKGLYVDTFGLGGDSAVVINDEKDITVGPLRSIPISILSSQYPNIKDDLLRFVTDHEKQRNPFYDFLVLNKDIRHDIKYTIREKKICSKLIDHPMIFSELADSLELDPYNLNVSRLEKEGVIQRSGFTPTDAMHIKGDHYGYDKEAAYILGSLMSKLLDLSLENFCDLVYEKVKSRLYFNIVKILMHHRYPDLSENISSKDLISLIYKSWDSFRMNNGKTFFDTVFKTDVELVGIGAPIHIFLPDVAKALNTICSIPKNAGVANAIGAVIGNIYTMIDIEVIPEYTADGINSYIVYGKYENHSFDKKESAIEKAKELAVLYAKNEAIEKGASGDLNIAVKIIDDVSKAKEDVDVYLGTKVNATIVGKYSFKS